MTIASGGHPLPVVLHPDGSTEPAGAPGSIIGLFEDARFSDRPVDLAVGDALVLYTDGVIDERRDDEPFGEERLRHVLTGFGGESAQAIADGVVGAVADFSTGRQRDDIAVQTIRVTA
jgi:serine phosphatase RsbU (regulator of sigma subunit)